MGTIKSNIDNVFNLLETKGIECMFYDWGIKTIDNKNNIIYTFEYKEYSVENVAKFLAHKYELRFYEIRTA